jgi:hypothetical protein
VLPTRLLVVLFISWGLLVGGVGAVMYRQYVLEQKIAQLVAQKTPQLTTQPSPSPITTATSSSAQLSLLQKDLDALRLKITALESAPAPTSTVITPAVTVSAPRSSTPFQKQVIYLGSASTIKRDWNRVGLEVTLNSGDYPAGTPVVFEAGLSAVGGEASARLINTTNNSILSVTELTNGTSTPTWRSSPQFALHPGRNTYAVEMKSSSDEWGQLAGARLVIGK